MNRKRVTPQPARRTIPREWEDWPGGRIGWSWETREYLAVPSSGRDPKGGFTSRKDAVEYLSQNN